MGTKIIMGLEDIPSRLERAASTMTGNAFFGRRFPPHVHYFKIKLTGEMLGQ